MQKEPISIRKGTLPMAEVMALTTSGMGVGEVGATQVERSSIAMVINEYEDIAVAVSF